LTTIGNLNEPDVNDQSDQIKMIKSGGKKSRCKCLTITLLILLLLATGLVYVLMFWKPWDQSSAESTSDPQESTRKSSEETCGAWTLLDEVVTKEMFPASSGACELA
jgi:flagellar basal body-associated protein FliL